MDSDQTEVQQISFSVWKWFLRKHGSTMIEHTWLFWTWKKAFDRVPRKKLWKAMEKAEYGIPPILRRAIRGMYRHCKSAVRSSYGEGFWFEVMTGVRQGSVLSPLLFILLMDQVLKQATTKAAFPLRASTRVNASWILISNREHWARGTDCSDWSYEEILNSVQF